VLRAGNTGGTTIDSETRETGPVDLSGVAALRYVLRVRGFRRLWMVLSEGVGAIVSRQSCLANCNGRYSTCLFGVGFNLANGVYTSSLADGCLMAGAINLWCVALGLALTVAVGPSMQTVGNTSPLRTLRTISESRSVGGASV
jgi:hypothetical protein